MSIRQNFLIATIILRLCSALLILACTQSANAECVHANCDNGYGIFIYEDGRIYEGQWKNNFFDGIGALTFQSGVQYTGEFKKGLMHGHGRITLQDGKQEKFTFNNGFIENNDLLKRLWETETNSSIEKHMLYYKLGNAYKKWGNYKKSIEYYDRALKIKPDFRDAAKNRILAKEQLAKKTTTQKTIDSENKPAKIVLQGTEGIRPGTHSRQWVEQEKRISEIVNTRQEPNGREQEEDERNITDQKQKTSSGTGFFINNEGYIVTNHHVIKDCKEVEINSSKFDSAANVISSDELRDLAIIKSERIYRRHATLRRGRGARVGEDIITVGYPLGQILGDTIKVTKGSISSVTGIANDKSSMQISAPIQPGSSGGPVLDMSGNVVGIVSSKLNELAVAKATGSLPQNINFAIKSSTLKKFLDAQGMDYEDKNSVTRFETADIAEKAEDYTVRVICYE